MNKLVVVTIIYAACLVNSTFALSQPISNNSNYWPVFRDDVTGFRISYPPSWIVATPKGKNVKFSVNPPDGPGNCNVVARSNAEIANQSQANLNDIIESLPQDRASWAGYAGLRTSQLRLISTTIARLVEIPALVGVIEMNLENLEGKYMRKQKLAFTFTPGVVWSLNCGATSFKGSEARERFTLHETNFNKILGSFVFTYEH